MKINLRRNTITHFNLGKNTITHLEQYSQKEHKPLSTSFEEIEVLPDGRILICEYYYKFAADQASNVYCLNRSLEIDWVLELPYPDIKPKDVYVGFNTIDDKYFANTWSGFRVAFDISGGKIINIEFTK